MTTRERTIDQVVGDALSRMQAVWPATAWGEPVRREYRSALLAVGERGAIDDGVTRAIRNFPGRFAPSVADLLEFVRAESSGPRPRHTPGPTPNHCPDCGGRRHRRAFVDENGIGSCDDSDHRWSWKVAG